MKVTIAIITNKSTATNRLAWLTCNASASQSFTTSHRSYSISALLIGGTVAAALLIFHTAKIGRNALKKKK